MEDDIFGILREKCCALSISPTPVCLVVAIPEQRLTVFENGIPTLSYRVSTSRNPPSCQADSYGTPWGLHRICARIGDGEPLGMVFKGRRPIGKCYWELPPEEQESNLITTRILRLEGLEEGLNRGPGVDSFARYIYLHGTNHEDKIGTPSSGGCVQLANREMVELYESVRETSLVLLIR